MIDDAKDEIAEGMEYGVSSAAIPDITYDFVKAKIKQAQGVHYLAGNIGNKDFLFSYADFRYIKRNGEYVKYSPNLKGENLLPYISHEMAVNIALGSINKAPGIDDEQRNEMCYYLMTGNSISEPLMEQASEHLRAAYDSVWGLPYYNIGESGMVFAFSKEKAQVVHQVISFYFDDNGYLCASQGYNSEGYYVVE